MAMLVMATMVATGAHAQLNLGRIKNSIKKSAENKAEWKIRKAADNAMDTAAEKVSNATKKKAKKVAKDVVGEKAANAVGLNESSQMESVVAKNGKVRNTPSPALDIKMLDLVDKSVLDDNASVDPSKVSDNMSDQQLLVAATLFFRQQIRNINEGKWDDIAKIMMESDNTASKAWALLDARDNVSDEHNLLVKMTTLNFLYTECMFGGVPYNVCASSEGYKINERVAQVRVAFNGNLEIPQFTKKLYYQLYNYYLDIAAKEKESQACKKLYVYYAYMYRLKAGDTTKFTDDNVEETDPEWKECEAKAAPVFASIGIKTMEPLAQLKKEKSEQRAKATAAAAAEEKAYWTARIPKGVNDPKTAAQIKQLAQSYFGNKRTVVKVIVEATGWNVITNIYNKPIRRTKPCTVITKTKDGRYLMQQCDISEQWMGNKYGSAGFMPRSVGDNMTGYEVNWKE